MSDGIVIQRARSSVKMAFKGYVGLPKTDQARAEAGTDNTTGMTPLRTAQAIEAQVPGLPVFDTKQDAANKLTSLSGLTGGANKLPYFTGTDAMAQADITAAGRALLDDADAAAQRITLGFGSAAVIGALLSLWETSLPTDPTGLSVGDWWSNSGMPSRVKSL